MACSSPAMEMDLSGRAGLLMREARDENSQEMEERMVQRLWSRAREQLPPKVCFWIRMKSAV